MVHLAQVPNNSDIKKPKELSDLEHIQLAPPGDDDFTASVYGSKFAGEDLPRHEMPEREMPKEVAYRLIKDDLTLDGNPILK